MEMVEKLDEAPAADAASAPASTRHRDPVASSAAEVVAELRRLAEWVEADVDLADAGFCLRAASLIERLCAENAKMQATMWSILKDHRDATSHMATSAQNALRDAIGRGWNSHLPALDDVCGILAPAERDASPVVGDEQKQARERSGANP